MNDETRAYIRQWLIKADEDWLVVETLTQDSIIAPSAACFHCQQTVEKLLKAYLIANGVHIRRTHNIEFLLAQCTEFDAAFAAIDPQNLSDFGVEIRYPDDMYIPSDNEVLEHKTIALFVKEFVVHRLDILLTDD